MAYAPTSSPRVWYRNGTVFVARKTSASATTIPGSAKAVDDARSTRVPSADGKRASRSPTGRASAPARKAADSPVASEPRMGSRPTRNVSACPSPRTSQKAIVPAGTRSARATTVATKATAGQRQRPSATGWTRRRAGRPA
jgi:hypothetical protein